jgi:CheY-like chemotaxis protein
MTGALTMMVGESITVSIEAAQNLGNVRADRDQIEQVVANIAVNARDAMAGGGRLTLRTRNIVLDDEYVRHHMGAKAGPHVVLSFQDSGVGMDEATLARIFEPFYTTKQEGLGSGLGLSIVYGIVKQSGGHVTVESEPGRGSTFKVFLPRVDDTILDRAPMALPGVSRSKAATVLFVEDDPNLFSLLRGILETAGYEVLAAPLPDQALALADSHEGRIDLLVTDVVMPGLSGPAVAERLAQKRPDLRILFISGYPKDVLERQTVLPQGTRLLGKPFSPRDLLATIQQVLDSPPPASGAIAPAPG